MFIERADSKCVSFWTAAEKVTTIYFLLQINVTASILSHTLKKLLIRNLNESNFLGNYQCIFLQGTKKEVVLGGQMDGSKGKRRMQK